MRFVADGLGLTGFGVKGSGWTWFEVADGREYRTLDFAAAARCAGDGSTAGTRSARADDSS